MGTAVDEFEQHCRRRGLDFEALSELGSDHARIRFTGVFHGTPLIWQARIMTLGYFRRHHSAEPSGPSGRRMFIEVGEAHGPQRDIRIGLNTPRIDVPTIRKTMVMVRQWKNLDYGLHEFGEEAAPRP